MTMNREVFLSLLALDAYNRGYGRNVFANGNAIDGSEGVSLSAGQRCDPLRLSGLDSDPATSSEEH